MTYTRFVADDRVGMLLRELLHEKGFKKSDLEERTGLSRASVERHCKGAILASVDDRAKYAKAFDVPFHEFERRWQESAVYDADRLERFVDRGPTRQRVALSLVRPSRLAFLAEIALTALAEKTPEISARARAAADECGKLGNALRTSELAEEERQAKRPA